MKRALIVAILFKSRGAVGGMAQRFHVIGAELAKSRSQVELLTTRSLSKEFETIDVQGIHVIDDSEKRIPATAFARILYVLIRICSGHYSRVHIAGAGSLTSWLIRACKLSGTAVSCTFASRTLDQASYGRSVDKDRWAKLLDSVDKVDVLNPGHELSQWEEKISISPCSFPSKRSILPTRYSETKSLIAVFCGALEPQKNPILALDIVSRYAEVYGRKVELVVFGKGVLEQELLERASRINSKFGFDLIRFGSPEEYGRTLSVANVFFSLQDLENYPSQSLMEAMLMGCKVIATDEGDTRLMFPADEPMNAIISSRDPDAFCASLERAFSDLRASKKNCDFIRTNHSLERFKRYMVEFLELDC